MFEIIPGRPDERGRYGEFGGRFVPEVLMPALFELDAAWESARRDPSFVADYKTLLRDIVGRPSMLYFAQRLSQQAGARIYLKREDLNHTGAHKINNTMGQVLLCKRMGKKRVIAETGAGQHGVATATACALFGFECIVYMGAEDVRRQALNVERMHLLGAKVVPVESGTRTLKDAMNEALRDWVTNVDTTYYLVGSAAGPHPYPLIVRDLQAVISEEARAQIQKAEGRLPDAVVACVGGGSNAIGTFHHFVPDQNVKLLGIEAAGEGLASGRHSASIAVGKPGVLHGAWTLVMQENGGQIAPAHSLAPGLDYPGVGPEHCYLHSIGRAHYETVGDEEAVAALELLAKTEGVLCALESAHAVAGALRFAKQNPGALIVVGLSGRGDKDMPELTRYLAQKRGKGAAQ